MPRNNSEMYPLEEKLIWDLPLRVFHWSMVITVTIAGITGYFLEEWWLDVHVYAGYSIGCLLAFRLIWGFIGSYYSRFHSYPLKYKKAISHLKNMIQGKSASYTGHNPVGAWMIVGLLSCLSLLIITGMVVWGGQENHGPLAHLVGYKVGDFSEDIHGIIANILMFAIAIHISGVFVETYFLKHPVINAMITGKKTTDDTKANANIWYTIRGAFVFTLIIGSVVYWGTSAPANSMTEAQVLPAYKQECGDCHPAYHPSLRTAASWQSIMNNLSDHYGEDASLDEQTMPKIANYLHSNNATSFDTEVSHKIGRHDTKSMRMTDTRYWQKKHDEIPENDFKHSAIGSKVNCNGCHRDADTGRYDDDNIKLPKGVKS